MNSTGREDAGRPAASCGEAVAVDMLPAAPGRLDALCRELGPELGLVVDGEGRPVGAVRWGLRGVEVVEA